MTIANRLLFGFMVGVLLMVSLGVYALGQIRDVRDEMTIIVTRDLTVYRQLTLIRVDETDLAARRLAIVAHYYAHDYENAPGALDDAISDWDERAHQADELLSSVTAGADEAERLAQSTDQRDMFATVSGQLREMAQQVLVDERAVGALFHAMRAGDQQVVREQVGRIESREKEIDQLVSQAASLLDRGVRVAETQGGASYDYSRRSLAIGLGAAVIVALIVTFWTRRSIMEPLASIMHVMERVGQGDLATRAKVGDMGENRDEVARLAAGLNRMIDGLREIARQSGEVTRDLDVAVADIRASTQQQAASVEEQFAAIQETAATVDQITHSGAQISKRAREVISSAEVIVHSSASGLDAVEETARAMARTHDGAEAVASNIVALSERTEAISEIITTVNDLSERSHLLALNAAIEAAAAGEHGRSFAVVAAEMKILADQSRDATQNVRSILGDIQRGINTSVMLTEEAVKRVSAGRERTDIAYKTIERMTGGIEEGVHAFQQIVASTNQQQLGIEQVMTALQSIRQASQQTSGGTRNLEASASNLGKLSKQLLAISARYRT
ncbi:methyl-accepting chemotaxis protein [Gluconacetobacter entanii]|uniref:Methyl-accepting chemotaxis protein n=1 Tax=Gluconacetobacter entanii TaxID=108528 RepID=A0A318PX21_9PROT|nr:methyl-accepting chemotaxis protein [Gluconacetobacter entanii]MBE7618696.1 HAMP domain-containing protein [Komagataeibacter sp. FXV2]MCE2577167.1 methyl-accepting chemotaxis protein [Komagataeibacter sp. FNDCR1]MBY4639633.1 methyl-accepting chemotaxis protein [Gluconacetobacter entanii]MCW4580306.1 methyl-accepting chemotaxis protein [Gluconacetobacter entanii]MCW4583628.1 methyl-accepting chemotaxis protein [Gluconacetobacter entanii]